MKILIVDDEALVRIGMRTIIPWEKHGHTVIGEATNGIEALRLARTNRPDIILVDIVMPEMNGLDFIKEIQSDLPFTKFIILSCRDDLDYYRQAIKLGVSEYVQKASISPEEILAIVERVSIDIRKNRVYDSNDNAEKVFINKNFVMMEFFSLVFKGQIKDSSLIGQKFGSFGFNASGTGLYVAILTIDTPEASIVSYSSSQDYSVIQICQEVINDMGEGFIFKSFNDEIIAVIFCPPDVNGEEYIKNLYHRINETIGQIFFVKLTAGVSGIQYDFSKLQESYCQAGCMLNEKFLRGIGKLYLYKRAEKKEELLSVIKKEKEELLKLRSPFEIEKFATGVKKLAGLLSEAESMTPGETRCIYMDILYHFISLLRTEEINIDEFTGSSFNPVEYIDRSNTIWELCGRLELLFDEFREYTRKKYPNRQKKIIAHIRQYVEQHINERISLDDISDDIHLSTSYISRFYKKETGENLQDYIIRLKVEKSKQLLYSNKSINEIIENVGFSSESHFFKVFKASTGLTPGQYMKQFEK